MKEEKGYCHWYGCTMNQITEEEQEDCDYADGDCKYCDKYDKDQYEEGEYGRFNQQNSSQEINQ